jgi:hypothetical protein
MGGDSQDQCQPLPDAPDPRASTCWLNAIPARTATPAALAAWDSTCGRQRWGQQYVVLAMVVVRGGDSSFTPSEFPAREE